MLFTLFVKRIIGLPGDWVEISGTSVKVNGAEIRGEELHKLGDPALNHLLDDHQAFRESAESGSYAALWRKDGKREQLTTVVPNGQVFVLGDNRDASRDSRHFGTLPIADVTAMARQVWFSADAHDGIRLRRTGKFARPAPRSHGRGGQQWAVDIALSDQRLSTQNGLLAWRGSSSRPHCPRWQAGRWLPGTRRSGRALGAGHRLTGYWTT